jgi:hypothetical protein
MPWLRRRWRPAQSSYPRQPHAPRPADQTAVGLRRPWPWADLLINTTAIEEPTQLLPTVTPLMTLGAEWRAGAGRSKKPAAPGTLRSGW